MAKAKLEPINTPWVHTETNRIVNSYNRTVANCRYVADQGAAIVRTVNCHRDLVEAIKKCETAFSAFYPSTVIIGRNAEHEREEIAVSDLLAQIRAVLAKVGR